MKNHKQITPIKQTDTKNQLIGDGIREFVYLINIKSKSNLIQNSFLKFKYNKLKNALNNRFG